VILAVLMAWPLVFFIGEPIAKASRARASMEQQTPRQAE
jgi:peptidoglycan/LPS O-acetylase OafA/YrhL